MKKVSFIITYLIFWGNLFGAHAKSKPFSQYVEPRIGTAHCRWFHFAPGAYPFGMAKPGPSTNGHLGNASGWEATGYDYRDNTIAGFPCFHEFQIGGITLMPTNGTLRTIPGSVTDEGAEGFRSRFSHDNEVAIPGYYSVLLETYGIQTELTATPRVAFQRYTYPASESSHLLVDIGNQQGESGKVKDAYVEVEPNGAISGWVETMPEYIKAYEPGGSLKMFFYLMLDKKPESFGGYNHEQVHAGVRSASGKGAGIYLTFPTKEQEQVTARIGLSYTSTDNAKYNLEAESNNLSFEKVRTVSENKWEELLGRIQVKGDNREDKVKFYTGLYHALLGRGMATDANGFYSKFDGSTGRVELTDDGKPAHNLYNTDAIWGTQWNLLQLWALVYPEFYVDYLNSHLQLYIDRGWLADGIACSRYVSGVGSNLLSVLYTAAYQCGLKGLDFEKAYEACRKNELEGVGRPRGAGKMDTDRFTQFGYVPVNPADGDFDFSASHTLEYSYSAGVMARWAKKMNKEADYKTFSHLAKGWERIFDDSTKMIRPRMEDGSFMKSFDPMVPWHGFQEGNAWQYTFYIPHDVAGLSARVGKEEFVNRMDRMFEDSEKLIFSGGKEIDAFSGLQTLYNHGNQPCLHISWLFNEVDRPSLSQKWVRSILTNFYGTDGIHGYGYGQDEDQGQLGAWYVISSMGLFDVQGLTGDIPTFSLGSPLFDEVKIHLNPDYYTGKTFVMKSSKPAVNGTYIKRYDLNGKKLDQPRVPFSAITKGGKLHFERSATPVDRYND